MHSRKDIAHVVGIFVRFPSNPKETHMKNVKRIYKIIKGTQDFGLWYKKDGAFTLKVSTDYDWDGNVDDGKRRSGEAFFLGEILITWLSKKQSFTLQYIANDEYVVAAINYSNIIEIKHLL